MSVGLISRLVPKLTKMLCLITEKVYIDFTVGRVNIQYGAAWKFHPSWEIVRSIRSTALDGIILYPSFHDSADRAVTRL